MKGGQGSVQWPSDLAFAAARSYGAYAADAPDPARRVELYSAMLDRDVRSVQEAAGEARYHAIRAMRDLAENPTGERLMSAQIAVDRAVETRQAAEAVSAARDGDFELACAVARAASLSSEVGDAAGDQPTQAAADDTDGAVRDNAEVDEAG